MTSFCFSSATVMIGDVECAVSSQTATSIVCVTGVHEIDSTPASAKYMVSGASTIGIASSTRICSYMYSYV